MFTLVGHGLIFFSELTNVALGNDKLHFKSLESERDFKILQQKFQAADGIKLPTDYLKKGRAYVCFNSLLEAQGGFALIDNGPFRTLEQIPDGAAAPVEHSMTELTAVCLTPGNALRRTRYWSFVVGQALTSRADNIVYAVDAEKVSLREKVFNHIRTHVLYEGPVAQLEGMDSESVEAVEFATKAHLARGFLKLAVHEAVKVRNRFGTRLQPQVQS